MFKLFVLQYMQVSRRNKYAAVHTCSCYQLFSVKDKWRVKRTQKKENTYLRE